MQIKQLEGDRESRGKGVWGMVQESGRGHSGLVPGSQPSGNSGSQAECEKGGEEKRSEDAA